MASDAMKGEPFLTWRRDENLSPLARRFLCWSAIAQAAGEIEDAGFASLNGAWACDDEEQREGARRCRERALSLLESVPKEGLDRKRTMSNSLICIDILRRTGRFDEAADRCWKLKGEQLPEPFEKILVLQERLVLAMDTDRHTIAEVVPPEVREREQREAAERQAKAEKEKKEAREASREQAMMVWAEVAKGQWRCSHCGRGGVAERDFRLSLGDKSYVICRHCGWPQEG
jgi:hypothetical protein